MLCAGFLLDFLVCGDIGVNAPSHEAGPGGAVRILGVNVGVKLSDFDDGVQTRGAVGGAQVYGLPLCLLRLIDASGSFGHCPVGDRPRPRDVPPWVGRCSCDSWGTWTLMEVREFRGLHCGCPGISVSGLIAPRRALGPWSRRLEMS